MAELLTQNSKIKHTGQLHGERLYNFGIPAYKSTSGLKTCPMAGTCAKGCYAQAGAYIWGNVAPAFEHRLALTQTADFVPMMIQEIERKRATIVRVHDSGDYYSLEYIKKWFLVMTHHSNVRFYSYTKMVPMFKRLQEQGRVPENLTLIFSYGGLADKSIIPGIDRHSAVFDNRQDLDNAGYAYASEDDLVAIGTNHKIGLVYHGAKTKQWKAGAA